MNILITGVGPHNKGAELMVLAILDQLRQRLPEAQSVITPVGSPFSWRAKLGLYQLFDPKQSGRFGWLRERLFHQGYRERYGLVLPEQIDAVLDASGYAFGDAWMPEHVENAATQFERYRKLGARIILLPQAFGPYDNARIRAASARILAVVDLVFARDPESLAYCKAIAPEHSTIHQVTDFTNLLQGILPSDWIVNPKHVALVPNSKMLTDSDDATSQNYVPMFAEAARRISAVGYHPIVIVHCQNDRVLAGQIARTSGVDCPVIDQPDPLAIKAILGRCAFTIGSRFHGLISSLSQGVPCIGTSWSHKYQYLFHEYGVPDCLCSVDGRNANFLELLDRLFDEGARVRLEDHLLARSASLRQDAQKSWNVTVSVLRGCE